MELDSVNIRRKYWRYSYLAKDDAMLVKILKLMRLLPVEIVNLICEYAVDEKDVWRIWFCPLSHKLERKFNKCCQKYIDKANIIMRENYNFPVIKGTIRLVNDTNLNTYVTDYTATFLKIYHARFSSCELYIQFDSEKDIGKQDKFVYRAMVTFDLYDDGGDIMLPLRNTLYLNGTPYGFITECSFYRTNMNTNNHFMDMRIELF